MSENNAVVVDPDMLDEIVLIAYTEGFRHGTLEERPNTRRKDLQARVKQDPILMTEVFRRLVRKLNS